MKMYLSARRFLQVFSAVAVLALGVSLIAATTLSAIIEPPGVPKIINPNESQFQSETHFLVFTGSDTAGESAVTAKAYYDAIDPKQSKRDFRQWLLNAGFISDVNQWHPTGRQIISCGFGTAAGCDVGPGQYGDNIINTDSHVIVLNAADLGFVRNQFIRCKPNCSAPNPIIYTYLENYPVAPFAVGGSGFSNLRGGSSYPTQAEARAAIESALNRPEGNLATNPVNGQPCSLPGNPLGCTIQRIADVAFEWAPPPNNPTSSSRYGQLYAYIFFKDGSSNFVETIGTPAGSLADGKLTPNVATRTFNPATQPGDPFPPNLDFLGFKQHPGVCFICHGGSPRNLTSTGAYPSQGKVDGFRFLPLDIPNLLFTSDTGPEPTSRLNQEAQLQAYNLAVLRTVPKPASRDEKGTTRVAHLREVIQGWYASGIPQKEDFLPVGWREPANGGTAPAGSEHLYQHVVAPFCRSCHFNRELTLDFGTAANFLSYKSDIQELALLPFCRGNNPQPGMRPMPLAHLTYQKFWEANNTTEVLPSGQPQVTLFNTAEELAHYLGYTSVAGYCAVNH